MDKFNEGDRVKIIGKAVGTMWEYGYIDNINEKEQTAIINYGSKDWPAYGLAIPEPLKNLKIVKEV